MLAIKPNHAVRQLIPNFWLYGEQAALAGNADSLHIEDIPSRSRKYLWNISAHRHGRLCQCVFVTSGPVTVELEGLRTSLPGPAAIMVPVGTIHGFRFRSETQGYVLSVDLDHLLAIASPAHQAPIQAIFSSPRAIDLRSDQPLAGRAAHLLGRLLEEFRQPESLTAPIADWLACCVLWMLADKSLKGAAPHPIGSKEFDRLRRFRHLVDAHFSHHWPVARYARHLSLSESSLNRLCRNLTGQTAFDLIQQRVVLEARRRLVYVGSSVSALAAQLGFKDTAYFSRFFRRHSGMSPCEYRRGRLTDKYQPEFE